MIVLRNGGTDTSSQQEIRSGTERGERQTDAGGASLKPQWRVAGVVLLQCHLEGRGELILWASHAPTFARPRITRRRSTYDKYITGGTPPRCNGCRAWRMTAQHTEGKTKPTAWPPGAGFLTSLCPSAAGSSNLSCVPAVSSPQVSNDSSSPSECRCVATPSEIPHCRVSEGHRALSLHRLC